MKSISCSHDGSILLANRIDWSEMSGYELLNKEAAARLFACVVGAGIKLGKGTVLAASSGCSLPGSGAWPHRLINAWNTWVNELPPLPKFPTLPPDMVALVRGGRPMGSPALQAWNTSGFDARYVFPWLAFGCG